MKTSSTSRLIQTNDLCINFTPTGMIPTKAMTPHVPVSVQEIVDDVLAAVEIGITMVHIHARDEQTGLPTWKKEVYARIIEGIRNDAPDLIICVSTSGRNFKTFEERSDCLMLDGDCKPDMASLTLSSLNFNKVESMNAPDMIMRLTEEMNKRGIKPELEAFDAGMINYAHYLIQKKLLQPPFYFNLLFGNIACAQADLLHAGIMVRDLPPDSVWAFAGIGDEQLKMNSIAIATYGGVRVGLEDNIWYDRRRTRHAKNIELIKRIHQIAEANERPVMPAATMRKLLDLQPGNGLYGLAG